MDRRKGLVCAAALAVLVFASTDSFAAGQEKLAGQYYKNKMYSFKFIPFEWTSLPPQPGEKTVVVHFRTEKAERGPGWGYTPECYVYRFGKGDSTGGFETYCKAAWRGAVVEARTLFKSAKVPANTQYVVQLSSGDSRGAGFGVVFHKEEEDIAVLYFCNEKELKKKYETLFLQSLMSFRFFDPAKDDDKDEEKPKEEMSAIEKRYFEEKEKVPPGWTLVPPEQMKNYYLVYYNCEYKDARLIMDRILAIRPEYAAYFPPTNQEFVDNAAPIIRICKTQRDFAYYSNIHHPGVLGYWSPGQGELVIFRKSDYGMSINELYMVLQHEGFHQYIFYACNRVSPCISFNEGGAEFFASFQPSGGKMVPTFENKMRAGTVKSMIGSNTFTPIRSFLELTQAQHYQNVDNYALGWALAEFIMLGDRSKVKASFNKRWKEIIPIYFKVLQEEIAKKKNPGGESAGGKGQDRETTGYLSEEEARAALKKALDDALDGVDLDEMTKVFKAFVKGDL